MDQKTKLTLDQNRPSPPPSAFCIIKNAILKYEAGM